MPREAAFFYLLGELSGLRANAGVMVRSQRGQARAFVSHVVHPGQVFMPMHDAATNQLTSRLSIRIPGNRPTRRVRSASSRH